MTYTSIQRKAGAANNFQIQAAYNSYENLIKALEEKTLPNHIQKTVENEISEVNGFEGSNEALLIFIRESQVTLLTVVKESLGFVAKHHYRNYWMPLGMTVMGVPFGLLFGVLFGNMAFIGMGLAIGIPLGMAMGIHLDNKAAQEGKQLNFAR